MSLSTEIDILKQIHAELVKQTRILEQKFPPLTDTEKVVQQATKDSIPGKPCKFCGEQITFKKEGDRFVPYNVEDGTQHRCQRK